MKCRDCGHESENLVRRRCPSCRKIYDYKKSHESYMRRKEAGTLKRCGVGICSVCGAEMLKCKPNQMTHKECIRSLSIVSNDYNQYSRDEKGQMVARGMVEKIMTVPKGFVVHHIDCDPENNVYENFLILSAKDHARLHAFLRRIRSAWLKDQVKQDENCWKTLIARETTTWLEMASVTVLKIPEIGQSASEPLTEQSYEEGSETMYVLPKVSNNYGKDIVRTLTT